MQTRMSNPAMIVPDGMQALHALVASAERCGMPERLFAVAAWRDAPPLHQAGSGLGPRERCMTATSSRGRIVAYWVTTALVAFELGSGGAGDVLRIQPVVEGMAHLGYTAYFCVILGVWKVLGAVAVLAPRFPRLKEWAYAGTVFDLMGAAASH